MKQTTLFFTFLLLSTVGVENIYAQYSKTEWLDGTWFGVGYQANALSQNTWNINLVYNHSTKEIKIEYPTFPCGGYWKLQEASRHKAVFVEYITDGKNLCQNEGTVVVTKIDENFVTVSYFLPNLVEGVVAFSTLQKQH